MQQNGIENSEYRRHVDLVIDTAKAGKTSQDAVTVSRASLMEGLEKLNSQIVVPLCKNLSALIGSESHLTVPLSDGTTAKVVFVGGLTKAKMEAFAKVFAAIAENFIVTDGKPE